ncbi:MAG: hypothetical protein IPJ42_21770 [Betaproteobacteria bacterium]|nr:hypothetical protein [Betaproteobacteria bacterium]
MAALGRLFGGGGAGGNHFSQTRSMSPNRWVDGTLYTRNNPRLADPAERAGRIPESH